MSIQSGIEQPTQAAQNSLHLHILGPPRVEWASHPLIIPRRQARALLYRLATSLQPLSREQLCYLFWPDTTEHEAQRNLSKLLTHLRRALPMSEIVAVLNGQVWLDTKYVWSDTLTFEQLYAVPEFHHRPEALQQVVNLYRGPFLAGFSLPDSPEFESWTTLERQTLERLYLEALAALIEDQTAKRAYETAITYVQRYLATDSLAEDMHRRLIELYAAIGDRSAALHQFEYCAVILERELGVSPLPETQAAYQAVLKGRSRAQPRQAPPPAWTTLPSLKAPLVGREAALRHLGQAYTDARSGQGRMVLISGEPGIGKSRLIEEFVTDLEDEATVIAGGGHEDEKDLPYWLLVKALTPHLSAIDLAHPSFEPLYLAPLAGLWPELQRLLSGLPAPALLELSQERSLLLQALTHLLLNLATHYPPVILCLDDLQWADEGTLAWLGYLARQLKHASILVLGAYRWEEMATVTALRIELARLGLLQEINLEGLSQSEVLHLIRYLSGQSSEAKLFSQRLHRETGGNPFFILETLRVLFETGLLWQDETGWNTNVDKATKDYRELPLPDTVGEAIRVRVRRLSSQTQQVLEASAVIGSHFSFDLVHATSGRQESEVIEALESLLARQIITESEGKYRFNHNLIRAVVYRDLSYGRRRLLHRRAGEALEKLQPNDAVTPVRHFERAEMPGRAAQYALRIGLTAKAIFAHAEARIYFDRALALLEQEAAHLFEPEAVASNYRLRVQALDERGWALRLLGDMETYARDTQEVARLGKQLGDLRLLARLHWREAYTYRWCCQYIEARQAAAEGLRLSQVATDLLLEALCQREIGLAARETGDYQQAQVSLERALQLFVDLGEVVYEIHTVGNLSTLCCYLGEYERAINLARQAMTRCEEGRLPLERRLPLGDMGAVAAAVGDVDLARQYLLESLAIARQIADRTQEIFCLGHLGWLCLRLKRPAQVQEFLQAALALAESIGSSAEQSWLWSALAEAHRLDGDLELAVEYARRALELAQASGRTYDQELARRILMSLGQTDL